MLRLVDSHLIAVAALERYNSFRRELFSSLMLLVLKVIFEFGSTILTLFFKSFKVNSQTAFLLPSMWSVYMMLTYFMLILWLV